MDAHRAGLRRDLGAIAVRQPNVHVQEIDASHDMVFEQPAEVAAIISDFLRFGTDFEPAPSRLFG